MTIYRQDERQPIHVEGTVRGLEHVPSVRVCWACNGRGSRILRGKRISCPTCQGAGRHNDFEPTDRLAS